MTGFWKTWMTIWCWAMLAFGAALAAAALPATDGVARLVYAFAADFHDDPALFDAPAMRFSCGLVGAVTIGWVATVFGLLRSAGGIPAVWRGATLAMVGWYVIDSTISVVTGFGLNAVPNTLALATYLAPVLGSGVLATGARPATA